MTSQARPRPPPPGLSPVIEAVRLPCFSKKAYRYRLSKAVQLQSTRPHCIHDTGIVDDLHWDAPLTRTDLQVWKGGGEGAWWGLVCGLLRIEKHPQAKKAKG